MTFSAFMGETFLSDHTINAMAQLRGNPSFRENFSFLFPFGISGIDILLNYQLILGNTDLMI